RLSEFYLLLKFLDFSACGGCGGMEIEGHFLDLASECVRRLVVRADGRAGIHTNVECFVGREAAGNSLVHTSLTDLFVIDVKLDFATRSDTSVGHKFDPYCGRSFRQWLRRRHFVARLAEPIVLINGSATFDVEGITPHQAACRDEHTVPTLFGHFDGSDDRVRSVLDVCRGTLWNPSSPRVIRERRFALDQTWSQAWIGAFDEPIVERQDVVLLGLDPKN